MIPDIGIGNIGIGNVGVGDLYVNPPYINAPFYIAEPPPWMVQPSVSVPPTVPVTVDIGTVSYTHLRAHET